jgi:hypothetical protein
MKTLLPHIEIGLDKHGAVAVSIEDYELFDFVADYVTEECDFEWLGPGRSKNHQGEVHTMYFNSKHTLPEIEAALLKLQPEEIEKIYAINN